MLPNMRWRILDGPNPRPDFRFTDGDVWSATLENVNDPAQRKLINVVITPSALASRLEGLPVEVQRAIETDGRSAIEGFLDEQVPPDRVVVSTAGVAVDTSA
jgi:predicted metal-dependent phosphotriesterase family hydrolase